ncbi:hypothetical protein [Micromonospora deserti]|uniref:hypothetical protein n=1 Tax=Micromonospora deserti TaxID=2070366 RepID=UPI0011B5EAF1|nr:hypothetical protein [Micromonospora deserti]
MLLDPETENDVAYELCQLLGRSIVPISRLDGGPAGAFGTAFFFRQLVAGGEVREYLLTADALTHAPVGEIGLRPSVTEPAGVAGAAVVLADFPGEWLHRPDLGAAIMPTAGLHEHADSQGWRWRTQQVTDAIAARADVIARIGAEPGSAFVLALGVGEGGSRPLEVAIKQVAREGDSVRVTAELPAGYLGAPVFGVQAGDDEVELRCLGLVLPARDGGHPLATFDRIHEAVAAGLPGQG